MDANTVKRVVWINKSNNQKLVTIPSDSDIEGGDSVLVQKYTDIPKCFICDEETTELQHHHVCYRPEKTVPVCVNCHIGIHNHGTGKAKSRNDIEDTRIEKEIDIKKEICQLRTNPDDYRITKSISIKIKILTAFLEWMEDNNKTNFSEEIESLIVGKLKEEKRI